MESKECPPKQCPSCRCLAHSDECGAKEYSQKVEEFFRQKTSTQSHVKWIPSLNEVPLHNLQTNSLVRFRGMIQDMYDPEFYLGAYEVVNSESGNISLRSGKYKDLAQCAPKEKVDMNSKRNVIMERQMLYCVPIPAENEWTKRVFAEQSGKTSEAEMSSGGGCKRSLENDSPDDVEMDASKASSPDGKKTRTDPKTNGASNSSPDLNFPLPGEQGPACLVKVYGDDASLKLNSIVEVIGVLSNDPSLANFSETNGTDEGAASMEGVEEQEVRSPPPSLVPRLHAIIINPLDIANPLLPPCTDIQADSILQEVSKLREDIMAVFSEALLGDQLAAQYLLCHLISTVYHRQDVVALGKFSLNISQCTPQSPLPRLLFSLLQNLTVKSHFLPLTLDNMNKLKFIPRKDYSANKISSGILQLSKQTNLVVDETVLQAGQLDASGVANMTALGNVISWQKVEYDFNFHKQDFPTDILVLILSEGKSILKCDCHVPLSASRSVSEIDSIYNGIETYLTPELLTKIRTFLTFVQNLKYTVPDAVQEALQGDFVERRRADSNAFSVDDFHSLLVLTRLLSLSLGQSCLSLDVFSRAKDLEAERLTRINSLPRSATSAAS